MTTNVDTNPVFALTGTMTYENSIKEMYSKTGDKVPSIQDDHTGHDYNHDDNEQDILFLTPGRPPFYKPLILFSPYSSRHLP